MKKTLFSLCCLALSLAAQAKSLVVVLADGTEVYYLLGAEKDPTMTYSKDGIRVNADSFGFSDVARFYISKTDDPSAIGDARLQSLRREGSTIFIPATGKAIAVVRTDGTPIAVPATTAGGVTALSLAALRPGCYVVSIGQTSFKISKK